VMRELVTEVRAGTVGQVRMIASREHRFPLLAAVDHWNRFNRCTGGTLVEIGSHHFDLMNLLTGRRPLRVTASGGQDVNHLDERYDGEPADVVDNAIVLVEYPQGVRAVLDLCMFAEASKNDQEVGVVGDVGKVEALATDGVLRVGRRADGLHAVTERTVREPLVRHEGLHHGASYLHHVEFLRAIGDGTPSTPPPVMLEDGLWSVAVGEAAQRSIDERRPVEIAEIAGIVT
jgi:myo-inositol 2-dehydrogenase / D-chiro-inositol 1-dehydrogenase